MNKQRKNAIKTEMEGLRAWKKTMRAEGWAPEKVQQELRAAKDRFEAIYEEEQDAYEKMSEKQQCSEQGEIAEECMALMEDALDYMNELIEDLGGEDVDLGEIGFAMDDVIELMMDIGRIQ